MSADPADSGTTGWLVAGKNGKKRDEAGVITEDGSKNVH